MGIAGAVGAFLVKLGVGAKAAAFIGSVVQFAAVTAGSSLIGKALAPGAPGIGSRNVSSRSTTAPQAIVYGEAVVAGALAYRNAQGVKNSELWAVHCLAGHEVSDITDIYLDDDLITDSQINSGSSAGGAVTTGTYAPARSGGANTAEIYKHLGTSTQTYNTSLNVAAGAEWTVNHRLRGIAYIVTMFKLNDRTADIWEAGDPTNVRAKVKGKIVYDPRLDTSPGANPDNASYFAWSDNPALCVADYLRDSKFSPLAGGIAASRIDWDAVEAAADDCDTLVFIPPGPSNTEKRFTCNGVIYGTASPEENLQSLLSSMNGTLDFVEGIYVIRAGVYESPVDSLDEADIIGPVGMKTSLDSDQRVNTMKAAFINPDKLYQADETAPISFSQYKDTRDGGDELFASIQLPMTNSNTMAQRIVLKRLQEADQELTITVPCNLRAARLVPGERVNVTITERGWTPKIFKVIDWEFFDRGGDQVGVNVTLREDESTAYADPDVADYNTYTNGTLTKATPTPIPSIDTIPRGIRFGEGAWNVELVNNSNDGTEDTNDGEVWLNSGTFILPDGTTRTITNGNVNTPYESTITPPDGRFYIIWGATSPDTRFGASSYGNTAAETAGLFAAIYDRFVEQWYAVDNSNNETAFTPAGTDYVVATGTKTSASGGIDSLTSLVTFVENPQATDGAQAGDNLLDESGTVLNDNDIANDQLVLDWAGGSVVRNGSFQAAGVDSDGKLKPVGWFRRASAVGGNDLADGFYYTDESVRDYLRMDASVLTHTLILASEAFRVNTDSEYEVIVRMRRVSGTGDAKVRVNTVTADLADGSRGISGLVSGVADSELEAADQNRMTETPTLTTSHQVFIYTYTPNAADDWAAVEIRTTGVSQVLEIDYCFIREKSTRNTGDLADQDTVGQLDIDNYSVARTSVATADNVDLTSAGYNTVITDSIDVPSNKTNSAVLIEISMMYRELDTTGFVGKDQGNFLRLVKMLDDGSANIAPTNDTISGLYVRSSIDDGANRNWEVMTPVTKVYVAEPGDLVGGQANDFTFQVNFGGADTVTANDVVMRLTLLNRSV